LITEECTRNHAERRVSGPAGASRTQPGITAGRRQATLEGMPVPPKRLKDLIEGTVDHHASLSFPDLQEVTIRWRGSSGYLTAWAGEGDDNDEQIPLCRIEYLGDDEDWGFVRYDPATETYTPAMLRTGQPAGHPNDAFDTAAIVHLADYQQ
jgi:hypothetical protein